MGNKAKSEPQSQDVTKTAKTKRLDKDRNKTQILTLAANPAVKNHTQIAEMLGLSRQTVARHIRESEPERKIAEQKLKEYDAQFEGGMNIAARAARYKELANQSSHPAVALQTLIRIDDLSGITTAKDNLRAINQGEGQQQPGPMFLMAPGSTVQVLDRRMMSNPLETDTKTDTNPAKPLQTKGVDGLG